MTVPAEEIMGSPESLRRHGYCLRDASGRLCIKCVNCGRVRLGNGLRGECDDFSAGDAACYSPRQMALL